MSTAHTLATFEQMMEAIQALPKGQTGEILGPGWMRTMSRPGTRHARAARRAARAFGPVDVDDGGEWFIEAELEVLLLGGKLYVPDLVGWRLGSDADLSFLDQNPIERVPDWACEILSRSTQRGDRVIKLPTYAEAGVGHVWVLDPEAETIEVYAPQDGRPVLVASARIDDPAVLPPFGVSIDVRALLAPVGRRRPRVSDAR